MVKGTDLKSVPGVQTGSQTQTRGVQMGPGRTMRTIDLFPVTTEMGYPARTMMQRRERAAGPV